LDTAAAYKPNPCRVRASNQHRQCSPLPSRAQGRPGLTGGGASRRCQVKEPLRGVEQHSGDGSNPAVILARARSGRARRSSARPSRTPIAVSKFFLSKVDGCNADEREDKHWGRRGTSHPQARPSHERAQSVAPRGIKSHWSLGRSITSTTSLYERIRSGFFIAAVEYQGGREVGPRGGARGRGGHHGRLSKGQRGAAAKYTRRGAATKELEVGGRGWISRFDARFIAVYEVTILEQIQR
jgi:hypothetical protein